MTQLGLGGALRRVVWGLAALPLVASLGCSGVGLSRDPLGQSPATRAGKGVADGFVFVPSRQVATRQVATRQAATRQAATGKTIPFAKIRIHSLGANGAKTLIATTQCDADGHYRLDGLPLDAPLYIEAEDPFVIPGVPPRKLSAVVSFTDATQEKKRDLTPATTLAAAIVTQQAKPKALSDSQLTALETRAEAELDRPDAPDVTTEPEALHELAGDLVTEVEGDLWVKVLSDPVATATVFLNGARVGTVPSALPANAGTATELEIEEVALGTVQLRVSAPGFLDQELAVRVARPEGERVTVQLVRESVTNKAPQITTVSVKPGWVPATGGAVTIEAIVTDAENDPLTVRAEIAGGGEQTTVPLTAVGNARYTGTFSAPANGGNVAIGYDVAVRATDPTHPTPVTRLASFQVAGRPLNANPAIGTIALTPETLPAAGGRVAIDVEIADAENDAITASAQLSLLPPGRNGFSRVVLQKRTGNVFHGETIVPENGGTDARTWTVTVQAVDTAHTVPVTRSTTLPQAGAPVNQAPTVASVSVQPTTLPHTGGTVTIEAAITDPDNDAITAQVLITVAPALRSRQVGSPLTMTRVQGEHYRATAVIPANPAGQPVSYRATVTATDPTHPVPATGFATFQVAAEPPNTPPEIHQVDVTPTNLPAAGGQVTIEAQITDAEQDTITAQALLGIPATRGRAAGRTAGPVALTWVQGNLYRGQATVPANTLSTPLTYEVTVLATDPRHPTPVVKTARFTVDAAVNTPPLIGTVTVQPGRLPASGGTLVIEAVITDAQGDAITAKASVTPGTYVRSRQYPLQTALSFVAGDLYRGQVTIPPNDSYVVLPLMITIEATDPQHSSQPVVQLASASVDGKVNAAPVINTFTVTPAQLAYQGGTVTIELRVTDADNDPLAATAAVALRNSDMVPRQVVLNHVSGDLYRGTHALPANRSTAEQNWDITVSVSDALHVVSGTGSVTAVVKTPNTPPDPPARRR